MFIVVLALSAVSLQRSRILEVPRLRQQYRGKGQCVRRLHGVQSLGGTK